MAAEGKKGRHPANSAGSLRTQSRKAGRSGNQPPPAIDYHALFENAPNGILVINAESRRCTHANRAACKLTGYSREELSDQRFGDLTVPSERVAAAEHFDDLKKTRQSTRTLTLLRKDRTCRTVELSAIDLGCGLVQAIMRDVTEYRQVVEELNDALQRLQFHVERMPLAYIVWDTDFRVEEWNPRAERIFGYSKAEAIGKHAYELIVPSDMQSVVDLVWGDLLKGDTSSHSTNDNVRKDGSRLTCEWFNTPLRDSSGRIRGGASMAMDVTEREAMEIQLRNAQRLESLGVLASGVAHDFNSSLMVILGNTSLLRGAKGLPAKALEYIEPIEDAGSRANDLIKHLLAYARTGRHNPESTDLNTVIKEAVGFIYASIGKQYELDLRLSKKLPTILADRGQIEQILLNFCLNAKQAMGSQGTIGIATRRANLTQKQVTRCLPLDGKPGPHVELVVSDTGCGMDEATVQRVFDPFFTTKPEGHGLGLAAVLGILRQHRGMAVIDSKVGQGTRIHVYFPVHDEGRTRTRKVEQRKRPTTPTRKRTGTKKPRS